MQKIKKILNLIWDEFIYGGHLLSLGASAIVFSTAFLLNIKATWEFLLIVYLGTQTIYNYNHYKELNIDILTNLNRTHHLRKYFKFLPVITSLYGMGFLGILFYFGSLKSVIFGVFLILSGILFTEKFKKFTKKIIGFKTFYTSLLWSLLVIFTIIYYSFSFNLVVLTFLIFVFLRWIINTSFFDIKDIESDGKEGLLTLPVVLGKEKFLNFLHIINFISFTPLIIGITNQMFPYFSLFLLLLFFYSFYYIEKAKDKKIDIQNLSYVMVDGEYLLWPLFLFLGKFC